MIYFRTRLRVLREGILICVSRHIQLILGSFGLKNKLLFSCGGWKKTYVYFLIQVTEKGKKLCERTKKVLKKNRLLCMIDIRCG